MMFLMFTYTFSVVQAEHQKSNLNFWFKLPFKLQKNFLVTTLYENFLSYIF